ncbi:hypothetical protein GCM10027614_82250 [Micromonospora vulcania]
MPVNRRFVEALMVGANHEVMRELLWRGYPTDQRGTPLHRFWDRNGSLAGATDDIPAIDEHWTGDLGTHQTGDPSQVVLIVRGELLRRYPRTQVYAVRAEWVDGRRRPVAVPAALPLDDPAHPERYPAFGGLIPPDIAYVGFDLPDDVRGDADPAAGRPGWFFVFQQPRTDPLRPGRDPFGERPRPGRTGPVLAGRRGQPVRACRPRRPALRSRPARLGAAGHLRRPRAVVRAEAVPGVYPRL